MATGFAKAAPERVFRLDSTNWRGLMGDREVIELWGIGKRTAARLADYGVRTVADLARADPAELATSGSAQRLDRTCAGWLGEVDRGR